jgi:hypothetical protein
MSDMLPSFAASPNLNPFSFDRHNRTPYLSQWSFGIQQSFKRDYLFELEYAGSTGQKLPERRNLNIAALDPTGKIPIAARVPFPAYGFVLLTYNGGWSSYNALTARLEKTFSNGLYMLASYTWEKSLDLGATDEFSAVSAFFKKFDKGISTFDVPHRFVYSYVYELPLGRGKRFGSGMNPALNKIASGWEMTGITTFAMGQFQTPSLGVDWLNLGSFTTSRPDIIGDLKSGRSFPDAYLNPAVFARPATHVEGNAARGSIEQPGLNNWDLGIFKNTKVGERFNAQFRWEMFNAWNHTQFGTANTNVASVNFGKIGGTLVGPAACSSGYA